MGILRQQFIDSQFMRIELTSYEKKWVHHNRYHLEITLDKQNTKIKKKYSQIKRFSQEIQKNLGVKNVALQQVMRSSEQYKSIEALLKRLNADFLDIKPDMTQKQKSFRRDIRNYLFNMLFYNDEMNQSDDDQVQEKSYSKHLQQSPTQLPKSSSTTTNQLKIDKSIKDKMALAASLVSTVLKKTETEPLKQIFKNINIIWLKRREDQWHECRLTTSDTSLILHDRYENVKIVIILCKMNVYCVEEPYQRIVLGHQLLGERFEFRLTNIGVQVKVQDDQVVADKYLAFYSVLKGLCHKQRMIETYNFIRLRFGFGKGSRGTNSTVSATTVTGGSSNNSSTLTSLNVDKKAKQIAFRLTHNTITTAFTIFPEHTCQILLPITSNFGLLQFLYTQAKQPNVIPSFKQNTQSFTVPVQNIYDALYNDKPKRKTEIRAINLETKSYNYTLNVDYEQCGTYETLYSCDNENDKFQGNQQFDQPNRDQVRIQFNRLKRIVWTIEQYITEIKDLERFTNPLASYLYYSLLVFIIIFTDMNYLLHYLLGVLIAVMLYWHPMFSSYLREVIEYFNVVSKYQQLRAKITDKSKNTFLGDYLDPSRKQNPQIHFKIDLQKKHFLDQFQLRMKKKRNIYKKYKRLQQILVKLQNAIMQLVNYIEKLKNIFTWYHHKKTKIVYLGLLAALCVIVFVPIRFMLLLGVYKKFKKGKKYFAQTREYNEAVVNEVFALTVRENKLDDFMQYLSNDLKVLNKKDSDYGTFERKVRQNLQTYLGIQFSPKIFQTTKTIKQLKQLLSLCKKRYKIPLIVCRKYELNEMYAYKESTVGRVIVGFITVIPSDRSILGVKAEKDGEGEDKGAEGEEGKEEMDAIDI